MCKVRACTHRNPGDCVYFTKHNHGSGAPIDRKKLVVTVQAFLEDDPAAEISRHVKLISDEKRTDPPFLSSSRLLARHTV